jgi:hypothetical protein
MKRLMISLLFALVAGAALAPEAATAFRKLTTQYGYAGKDADRCAENFLNRMTRGSSAVVREVLAGRQNTGD